MISAWWLLIICPVCGGVGFVSAAILAAGKEKTNGPENIP